MSTEYKIEEAEFNLKRVQNRWTNYFGFEVSNFLSSTQSIFYYLLEEYRIKFGLILQENYSPNHFKDEAKTQSNLEALNFIRWYQDEKNKIELDKNLGFLIRLRHLNVHKQIILPTLKLTKTTENTEVTKSYMTAPWGKVSEPGKYWVFLENQTEDPVKLCELLLKRIKKMVNDAYQKYPK